PLWAPGPFDPVLEIFIPFDRLTDCRSFFRILQALYERVATASLEFRRHDGIERSRCGRVGILVGSDVEPFLPGLLDGRDHLRHLAPVLFPRNLEVEYLDWN